jgi:hypothetical protein
MLKAASEVVLYILSIIDYANPQPEDPMQPVGSMPVFRSEEAAREFLGGTGADIMQWTVERTAAN